MFVFFEENTKIKGGISETKVKHDFLSKGKKNKLVEIEPRSRCKADRRLSKLGDLTVLPASALTLSGITHSGVRDCSIILLRLDPS